MRVRKAVFPAAGWGTRFLPATKAQPKEMLPLVDKPIIQYGVEEAVASGIDNIILVTGRGKNAIEDHFDVAVEQERIRVSRDLHDVAGAKWWLTDLASPMLLKFLEKRWSPALKEGNAPFRFGPAEGTAFFAPFGWREVEFRSSWDESFRLKRTMRGAWFWKLLSHLQPKAKQEAGRRMSGIVLMQADRAAQ